MILLKASIFYLLLNANKLNPNPKRVTVFAPAGEGSVGDQAMLDALCEQLSTKNISAYIVYMPGWNTTKLRPTHTNIRLGHGRVRFVKLIWAAFRSSSVVVVGADVLDGAYGEWMPLRWIGKLTRANKIGRSVGFINFSFSPDADPTISERLRATGGLRFIPRDPVSLARVASARAPGR